MMHFSIDSGYSRKNQRYAWSQHDAGAVLLRKMESKDLIGKEKRTHSFTDNEHNKITA